MECASSRHGQLVQGSLQRVQPTTHHIPLVLFTFPARTPELRIASPSAISSCCEGTGPNLDLGAQVLAQQSLLQVHVDGTLDTLVAHLDLFRRKHRESALDLGVLLDKKVVVLETMVAELFGHGRLVALCESSKGGTEAWDLENELS
eukprot:CAMPEP_0174885594 /NCGR_PEP_ID=MMETSP0167-20121228/847_1 /TAXON_ID=38298 /ORGANISM="Rhodella maculata, Strain CCMP736" /LENGTH=146 /DNA_ID=CAMNT_0016121217 /DNA_START=295 /DNA_END=736 /DNA_ORIENTATION=+